VIIASAKKNIMRSAIAERIGGIEFEASGDPESPAVP
jgi:hypothetical protein